jgi:glycogen debranching enzyme
MSRYPIYLIQLLLILFASAEGFGMLPANSPRYEEDYLDSLAIEMEPGSGRPYLFSGIGTSFFYGTTETIATDGWMGLHDGDNKLLDDWILVIDGIPKDRAEARVTVKPHEVVFNWPDSVMLTVAPASLDQDDLRFTARLNEADTTDFRPGAHRIGLFFVFPAHLDIEKAYPNKTRGVQYYLGTAGADSLFMSVGSKRWFEAPEMRSQSGDATGPYARHHGKPIHGVMFDEDGFDLVFTWAENAQVAGDRMAEMRRTYFASQRARTSWLLNELNQSYFHCDDERINKAVNWAKLSVATLFAEDENVLWAGLPWFSEGWARDTFISLPGVALVLGKFDVAANILNRYSQWQNTDPDSPDYGKVPNRARGEDIIYNTADGTPWFIRELYEYGLYSGDRELWQEMGKPGGVVEMSVEGAIKYHVDDLGFLTHGEADTWMDAKGPNGAWSPRGNRAVEIQALWLAQLQAATQIAGSYDNGSRMPFLSQRWGQYEAQLITNFRKSFIRSDGIGLVDHLNEDGSSDLKIRPNQAWAITVPLNSTNPLLTLDEQDAIVKTMREHLVYNWGVASLSQRDDDFHPYHQTQQYPKDAAYHMGIVWTWLSGPFKSASRSGWGVAENEIHQILDRGVPGTLCENLDALPRAGMTEPQLSGTVSQTWSNAEFIRTIYQDYLGIEPVYDEPGSWSFDPAIPAEMGNVDAILWLNGHPVRFESEISETQVSYLFSALQPDEIDDPIEFSIFPNLMQRLDPINPINRQLSQRDTQFELAFERIDNRMLVNIQAGAMLPAFQTLEVPFQISADDDLPFLQPRMPDDIPSLAPPVWPMLPGEIVTASSEKAPVVFHVHEEERDDRGVVEGEMYGYPTDSMFKPGILDLMDVVVRADDDNAYFNLTYRDLVDPGWHPYYGYQLTFTTIAIRTGRVGGPLRTFVGRNSMYQLPPAFAADRFIHVGGGIEVEDAEDNILAAFVPSKPGDELGNVGNKSVSFAIPLDYLGSRPEQWKIAIMVGAQDDHGGGGIGEFRQVTQEGGRWAGSGRTTPSDPNVYDVMFIEPERSGE